MFDVADILSSRAKFRILRTLARHTQPLPLRHIAYLSEVPIYSAQRALAQLADEKILLHRRKKPYLLFSLNKRHPSCAFLTSLFALEMKCRIAASAEHYAQEAKNALRFADAAQGFFKKLRPWN